MIRRHLTRRGLCGLVLSVSTLMAGCSDNASPIGPTGGPSSPSAPQMVDRTFTLGPNGTATVDNGTSSLNLRFKRVVSDSRCPGDALCMTAGTAVLEFDFTSSKDGVSYGSTTQIPTDGPNSEAQLGAYSVDVEQLMPYPFASLPPINPEEWRATVRIKSATIY